MSDTTIKTPPAAVGACPRCGRDDGILNVGADHWGICERHGVKWWIGRNLSPDWQREPARVWLANERKLAGLTQVEPRL